MPVSFSGGYCPYKQTNSNDSRFSNLQKILLLENRRNNICLIPLLDAHSLSRWCIVLKMFEIPAYILINSDCLLQPIKTRKR